MSGDGVRRVVRPRKRYMTSRKEQSETRSRLLSRMDAFYTEASGRLLVAARSLDAAGICVGLLDPVSNIMANAICAGPDQALAGAVVEEKRDEAELGKRSLEGLVAFLLYFFPYMASWEAVRYLLLADADLLAAARLIVADRGMTARFSLNSAAAAPAVEEALTLAAEIANHPQPKQLAQVWMQLSSRLHQVLALLQQPDQEIQDLDTLKTLLEDPAVPHLATPWDIAASRQRHHSDNIITNNISYQHTRSLRMVLLDAMHGYYLKALAILPRGKLRSCLHRSLLRAGNCYGPLDPVSNIILNTLWYDANFPAAESVTPVLDVIGPNSLTRLVSRSFYGLVSFLQTRYHDLSEHRIVQCLVAASGRLSVADPKLLTSSGAKALEANEQQQYRHCLESMPGLYDDAIRKMEQGSPCSDVQEAYAAAATAAWHPNPEEQAKFLASCEEGAFPRHPIAAGDVQRWSSVLSEKAKPRSPERIRMACYSAREGRARSMNLQRRISRKVKNALDRHLLQDGKPTFDLHIICCVNEDVCGPEFCADVDPLAFAPYKYRYSHVNFLATERGPMSDSDAMPYPVLFFAEFDNEDEDGAPLFLCQVQEPTPFAEHVRCLYCEAEGVKVVHPPSLKFHGGGSELEEMIRGKHEYFSRDFLICKNEHAVQILNAVEEDFMYVDVR